MSTKMRRGRQRSVKNRRELNHHDSTPASFSAKSGTGAVIRVLRHMPKRIASLHELERALHIRDQADRKELRNNIRTLLQNGEIIHEGKRLKLAAEGRELAGEVMAHPDGYGFVRFDNKRGKDAFIPPDQMTGLMTGDRIAVRMVRRRGRQSAEVLRILETATNIVTGQFSIHRNMGVVTPRSRRTCGPISVRSRDAKGACNGDWVRVEIKRGSFPLQGRVIEVLRDILHPSSLIDLVVSEQELPGPFNQVVLDEATAITKTAQTEDERGRMDLTHLPFVTIDGDDAKDFDDAICVMPRGEGFELWVAIADVAHYVTPGSHLDIEARIRANSFYFPDRVIPMLPEMLSNGICSLKPDERRMVIAVRQRYDAGGRRRAVHIHEAMIRSHARLTYRQVNQYLEKGDNHIIGSSELENMLQHACKLYRMMNKHRGQRGALDIDIPELQVELEHDEIINLRERESGIAQRLIEECMLASNTAIAAYLESKGAAFLYRVHKAPEIKAIEALNDFLAPMGLTIRQHATRQVHPKELQHLIRHLPNPAAAHVIHRLILRSMQQAFYAPENAGHFGLAYKSYTHFTSPIRRYADLTVHRRLKAVLNNASPERAQRESELADIGEQTSRQERRQMQAERDSADMLASLYHRKDVGKCFQAIISGLTEKHLYFELQPSFAEASMSVADLARQYTLDARLHRLVERITGHTFALGDQVQVIIDSTDPVRGIIRVRLA